MATTQAGVGLLYGVCNDHRLCICICWEFKEEKKKEKIFCFFGIFTPMLASCPVGSCTCTDNIQTANKDRIFLALNGSKCLVSGLLRKCYFYSSL